MRSIYDAGSFAFGVRGGGLSLEIYLFGGFDILLCNNLEPNYNNFLCNDGLF